MRKVRFAGNATSWSAVGLREAVYHLTLACRSARHFEGVDMRTSGVSLSDKLDSITMLDRDGISG
jgi:hypothetical protein